MGSSSNCFRIKATLIREGEASVQGDEVREPWRARRQEVESRAKGRRGSLSEGHRYWKAGRNRGGRTGHRDHSKVKEGAATVRGNLGSVDESTGKKGLRGCRDSPALKQMAGGDLRWEESITPGAMVKESGERLHQIGRKRSRIAQGPEGRSCGSWMGLNRGMPDTRLDQGLSNLRRQRLSLTDR